VNKVKYNSNNGIDEIAALIETARGDSVIGDKLVKLLKMDSFHRRSVLVIWLELLRIQNAPESFRHALSLLFDDDIAQKTFSLINK
jgi:hypothetical protein